jgi:hypothetical protein
MKQCVKPDDANLIEHRLGTPQNIAVHLAPVGAELSWRPSPVAIR